MANEDYVPRLTVDLRPDQQEALKRILPHGTQKLLFHAVIDGIISIYNKGGFEALGPILTGHIDAVSLARAGHTYTQQMLSDE